MSTQYCVSRQHRLIFTTICKTAENSSSMHEHKETGSAFAIPDLWEKSALADFEQYVKGAFIENERALFAPSESMNDGLNRGNKKFVQESDSPAHLKAGDYFSTSFPFPPSQDLDLDVPDLTSFEYGPLEDLDKPELSSASSIDSSIGSFLCQEQEGEDIWSSTQIIDPGPQPAVLKSWEKFYHKASKEPRTAYISEGGPGAFDAALISQHTRSGSKPHTESAGRMLQYGLVLTVKSLFWTT